MHGRSEVDGISRIAILGEPTRRALYELVRSATAGVGREEAATTLGIGRGLAAFHLDRLVAAGLLGVEFRRLNGRSGPGAGRPAKLYVRRDDEVEVSLPQRRYALAAALVTEALARLSPEGPPGALLDAARREGLAAGRAHRDGPPDDRARAGGDVLIAVLRDAGYEPVPGPQGVLDAIELRNCPFDALARRFRDLACPMNVAFLEGIVAGLGDAATALVPVSPVRNGRHGCCVAVRRAPAASVPSPAP